MMPKEKVSRKRLFNAALALNGQTALEWAKQEGISPTYLSLILNGHRPQLVVTAKIDTFIRQHLSKHVGTAA
jgi:predicted transcriptional regulator